MKKLLGLGFADIIWSVLPIVFWYLIGILWGDDYSNGFIIGYSFQFINLLLRDIFIIGSLKSWVSENKKVNYFGMGFTCYLIISIFMCVTLSVFGENILSLFGYKDMNNQALYKIYAWQFTIDGIIMGISYYFQYKDRRKISQKISYLWFIIRLISLLICWNCYKNDCIHALKVNNSFLLIVSSILALVCINFKNMKWNLRNWMNRESYNIMNHFIMFIIYLIGVGDMSNDVLFLTAYNIMAVCSDIHWDLEGSIDTYVSIEASEGDWNKKKRKVLKNTIYYSLLLLFSSLLMVLLSGNRTALYIWLIEMSLYLFDCIGTYFLAYVSVKSPNKWMWILGFIDKIIRLCVQLMIVSSWGIPIACFVGCLIFCIGSSILYYKVCKELKVKPIYTNM